MSRDEAGGHLKRCLAVGGVCGPWSASAQSCRRCCLSALSCWTETQGPVPEVPSVRGGCPWSGGCGSSGSPATCPVLCAVPRGGEQSCCWLAEPPASAQPWLCSAPRVLGCTVRCLHEQREKHENGAWEQVKLQPRLSDQSILWQRFAPLLGVFCFAHGDLGFK